jgi:hypothetical protein
MSQEQQQLTEHLFAMTSELEHTKKLLKDA